MRIKFVNKLIISFIVIILLSTIWGLNMSNHRIDENFDDYLKDKKGEELNIVVDVIENNYDPEIGIKNQKVITGFINKQRLEIRVEDLNGQIIFETKRPEVGEENKEFESKKRRSDERFGEDDYVEESFPLVNNDKRVATIFIGHYAKNDYDKHDLDMKNAIFSTLIKTSITTFIIGIIISIFLAKHFSIPLKKLTKTTNEIRKGNLRVRSDVKSYTYEIDQLSDSINYLAKTLENEDSLRKRLTSDMAHEIRTPLTTLQNTMEAFLYGIWEPTKERIESCYEEIERLSKLVEGLKDIAKLEEAKMFLNKTKFNLAKEVNQLLELFRPQYENKNIDLVFSVDQDIEINSDKDKIKQILINLLNNAYNYTDEGGKVEVILKDLENKILLQVKDSGIGISDEDIPFIFERFYRTDETRNRKTGGTGIGLAITNAMVQAIEGSIEVESKVNKGSTFTVYIPK